MLLSDLTKLALAVEDVDRFAEIWWLVCHLMSQCCVGIQFRWNPTLFARVMATYTGLRFFVDSVHQCITATLLRVGHTARHRVCAMHLVLCQNQWYQCNQLQLWLSGFMISSSVGHYIAQQS